MGKPGHVCYVCGGPLKGSEIGKKLDRTSSIRSISRTGEYGIYPLFIDNKTIEIACMERGSAKHWLVEQVLCAGSSSCPFEWLY